MTLIGNMPLTQSKQLNRITTDNQSSNLMSKHLDSNTNIIH